KKACQARVFPHLGKMVSGTNFQRSGVRHRFSALREELDGGGRLERAEQLRRCSREERLEREADRVKRRIKLRDDVVQRVDVAGAREPPRLRSIDVRVRV